MRLFRLEGHEPVPWPDGDLRGWLEWYGDIANRRVAEDTLPSGVWLTTVFLGMNHGVARPELFETKVFGGTRDGAARRYATWDEAAAGHDLVLRMLRGEEPS